MITIIADTQHIAKRYARIVGANDEDTRHYVGNNYAVTWLEGIDLGFSPELSKTLDRLSPTALPYFPDRYPVVLLPHLSAFHLAIKTLLNKSINYYKS